jgi:hypothetical protein
MLSIKKKTKTKKLYENVPKSEPTGINRKCTKSQMVNDIKPHSCLTSFLGELGFEILGG